MLRKEFINVLTTAGMVPLQALRPLLNDKDEGIITDFELLQFPNFDDKKLAESISARYKIPLLDIGKLEISSKVSQLMQKSQMAKFRSIPVGEKDGVIMIAIYDPTILSLAASIQMIIKKEIGFILTNLGAWKKAYETAVLSVDELVSTIKEVVFESDKDEKKDAQKIQEDVGEKIVSYVNQVLAAAFSKGASDIHFEPYEKIFRVRFRIDGDLIEYDRPSMKYLAPTISRVKIMSQMDISERRKPQDGRIKLIMGGRDIDYRVSAMPTLFGEKIVLRLLDKSNLQLDMTKLGFEQRQIDVFKEAIHRPYGMCLVTGPTGSGKTTTLYSALCELNTLDVNISTAEDPVEFNLEGINQVNVRKDIGLTFAAALKSFLRQDPDIVMVGEIRDQETGEIAVEAALTGHLVLSTLHTNDAPATVTRLLNMGIEPFLLTASLNVVVAQRLCRKICTKCKIEEKVTVDELVTCGISKTSAEKLKVYRGKGCDACNGSGYKGRVAIYEVMTITPSMRNLIFRNASSDELKVQAVRDGMKTLRMAALTKVAQGLTTLQEAIQNSAADDILYKRVQGVAA